MKAKVILLSALTAGLMTAVSSYGQVPTKVTDKKAKASQTVLKDHGAGPTVLDIDSCTIANDNFRLTLWTGGKLQVALMSIPAKDEVGLEQHRDTDQFIRIEEGSAKVMMGDSKDKLDFVATAVKDDAIFVPAAKWHNIVNTGSAPLKLYTIYAPVEHPRDTVQKTHEDAKKEEHHD